MNITDKFMLSVLKEMFNVWVGFCRSYPAISFEEFKTSNTSLQGTTKAEAKILTDSKQTPPQFQSFLFLDDLRLYGFVKRTYI